MSKKRPNILWLMSDQHNANCMSAAGHPDVKTPNLDQLAKDGVLFSHAYCNNPICAPSRATFLSGQYVKSHGISGNFVREVQCDAPNLARLFRKHGYQTALIGKAHLPCQWVKEGFETIRLSDLCDADAADPESCDYFKDLIDAGLADRYEHGARLPGEPGFGMRAFVSGLPEKYSPEVWTKDKAVEFLRQRNSEQPFFLKVSFQRPHDPYSPPASRADEYDPESLNLPETAVDYFDRKFSGKPVFQQEYVSEEKGMGYPFRACDPADLKKQMAAYFTLISMMDDAIGAVLQEIDAQGELDNTIIVYVADHGDFAGEHGLMLKNFGIYESIHRIPFIIAGPGVPSGQRRDRIIESVDFYPTLAELAGIPCEPSVDGTSRVKEILSNAGGCEYTVCEWEFLKPQSHVFAVRNEKYRFVFYTEFPDDGELYDVENDPGELNNLFHEDGFQDVRDAFCARLKSYFSEENPRVHAWKDDFPAIQKVLDQPSIQIHQQGKKWSEVHSIA
ncbi:MAG: sulfatase [Kiritimatiellales bacterium]